MDALDVRVSRVGGPVSEPLAVADVKLDRVVEHDQHDLLFEQLIMAAREQAESATGRALMPQVWRQVHPCSDAEIQLYRWPVTDIQSVMVDGVALDHAALLASGEMELIAGDDAVVACDLFRGSRVVIEYGCGYADAQSVPASIRKWMLCQIGAMYEHREAEIVGSITSRVRYVGGLLGAWRVRRFY